MLNETLTKVFKLNDIKQY